MNRGTECLRSALLLLTTLVTVPACGSGGREPAASLQGVGATFPYPLYSKWISEFNKLHPDIRIDYQSIGSGGGIKQLTARTVDFGASDIPMTDDQLGVAREEILHIPTVLGPVVIGYNVGGLPSGLKLTPDVLADIFLGRITKWNDPRLAALNSEFALPAADMVVVHRSDGSGTTAIFVDYLSKVSSEWATHVGRGASVNWPVGLGAKGNEGVAGQVKQAPGTMGYVELAYAEQNRLSYASVRNRAGKFIKPTLDSVTAAATRAVDHLPEDLRISITDAEGEESYPIAGFTYILVFREQPDLVKGRALAEFLSWLLHDGNQFVGPLHYAPLPTAMVERAETKLQLLTHQGRPLPQH